MSQPGSNTCSAALAFQGAPGGAGASGGRDAPHAGVAAVGVAGGGAPQQAIVRGWLRDGAKAGCSKHVGGVQERPPHALHDEVLRVVGVVVGPGPEGGFIDGAWQDSRRHCTASGPVGASPCTAWPPGCCWRGCGRSLVRQASGKHLSLEMPPTNSRKMGAGAQVTATMERACGSHLAWQQWPAPRTRRQPPVSRLLTHRMQEGWAGTGWHGHCPESVQAHGHSDACCNREPVGGLQHASAKVRACQLRCACPAATFWLVVTWQAGG